MARIGWVTLRLLLVVCTLGWLPAPARAQSTPLSEYAVKAALLFNIAKYADWPPGAFAGTDDPIVIGILGADPFGEVLDRVVHGRVVNGRPFMVRRAEGIGELKGAHLVFVSAAVSQASAQDCAVLESYHVLTVGDSSQTALFTAFNFAVEDDRIIFTVDLERASRAGVTLSSRLLHFAKTVKRGREMEGGQ